MNVSFCLCSVQSSKELLAMASIPVTPRWSLPVPSVQELAIQRPDKVPPRYIRDDVDDIATAASDPTLHVPLIDVAKLINTETQEKELQKLHLACKDWGLFQLVNHGVCDESLENTRKQVEGFFELPLEEKKRCAKKTENFEGYGQVFVTSEEQKLNWGDRMFLKTLPKKNRQLEFWPQNPPHFREALERYSEDMRDLATSMVKFISMALGIEVLQISESFQEGRYHIRINFYPPCPEPERVLGFAPHVDVSMITLVLDCGEFPGLQVLKDDKWVFVAPIQGAIVATIGQITEVISNGIYKAPLHRAVANKRKERLSIVTFCYPSYSLDIGPAQMLVGEGNPAVYKTLTQEGYFDNFFSRKIGESFVDKLKI